MLAAILGFLSRNYCVILAVIGPALAVYVLAYTFLYWQLPRRHPHPPGIILVLLLGVLGAALATHVGLTNPLALTAGSAVITFLGFYIVVKIGTPLHAGVVVNCQAFSEHEMELKKKNYTAPFAWPYPLVVGQEGSVTWYLHGEENAGWTVEITFPPDNHPFGKDQTGKERNRFTGTVPGFIAVGPVVSKGRGEYTIKCRNAQGQEVTADPPWDTPWKQS